MASYFVGIDCGLTCIKAAVFDKNGNLVQSKSIKNSVVGGMIDTELLWKKVVACIKQSVEGVEKNIKAVSVCGHGNGLYLIVNGKPYKTAYSSMYNGTEIHDKRISEITLQTVWAGQPLNILCKLREENRKVYQSIDKIFFCKDFIRYMLTGVVATDYSDASASGLLDNNTYTVNPLLYSLFGLNGAEKFIPDLYQSCDCAGYITESVEKLTGIRKGTPVAIGAFDVCGCLTGAGINDDSKYSIISGTWGINASLTKNKVSDNRITQCCSFIDKTFNLCIESAPTSCVNLEWLLNKVFPFIQLDDISELAKWETDLIYLPFIYPTMRNPAQKAEFVNLNIEHTYKDMVKAVLEGVVYGHRMQLDALKLVGLNREEIVLSGGATNSDAWCQLFADILNTPIIVAKEKECGALGAAIYAMVVHGEYKDVKTAQRQTISYEKKFKPQKNYDVNYNEFLKIIRRNNGFRI